MNYRCHNEQKRLSTFCNFETYIKLIDPRYVTCPILYSLSLLSQIVSFLNLKVFFKEICIRDNTAFKWATVCVTPILVIIVSKEYSLLSQYETCPLILPLNLA